MTVESSHWLFTAVAFGIFFVLIVAVGLWEKRRVQTFLIPEAGCEYPLTSYGRVMNQQAQRLGYAYGGAYHDARESIYKTRFDFWTSPDKMVLACVSCGTIAGLRNARVNLLSQWQDGRLLQTTDMTGENDLSGLTDLQIWPKHTFPKLLERHLSRMKVLESPPLPFSVSPLRELLAIRLRRAEKLVENGDARFVDEGKNVWKLTLKGALRFYFIVVWVQTCRRGLRRVGAS